MPDIVPLFFLCIFAFVAGFIDAIVGGGGLIQTPAGLILLPDLSVSSVVGSLKVPAFTGTALAVRQYMRKIKIRILLLLLLSPIAFVSSYLGSIVLTKVSNAYMKPIIFIVLIFVAIYTFLKKDLGMFASKNLTTQKTLLYAIPIVILVGFYDGFIGPGTGSFLVLSFIGILGYDFLTAGTYAKMINLATNLGSIFLFVSKGIIIWEIAITMAIFNGLGGYLGSQLAIRKGNKFIKVFFLCVVIATLIRFGYDIFFYNN